MVAASERAAATLVERDARVERVHATLEAVRAAEAAARMRAHDFAGESAARVAALSSDFEGELQRARSDLRIAEADAEAARRDRDAADAAFAGLRARSVAEAEAVVARFEEEIARRDAEIDRIALEWGAFRMSMIAEHNDAAAGPATPRGGGGRGGISGGGGGAAFAAVECESLGTSMTPGRADALAMRTEKDLLAAREELRAERHEAACMARELSQLRDECRSMRTEVAMARAHAEMLEDNKGRAGDAGVANSVSRDHDHDHDHDRDFLPYDEDSVSFAATDIVETAGCAAPGVRGRGGSDLERIQRDYFFSALLAIKLRTAQDPNLAVSCNIDGPFLFDSLLRNRVPLEKWAQVIGETIRGNYVARALLESGW
jgi:hypothetical protein